ncbi:MBL fold metallo-hydrolase [Aquisalimonas lutea]|uniref:MBL fold metallo-hydrolase n=1 Tax=Aquisalimonas lutea TaxID=1327750 RepID=UPI0025B57B2F|nr:MBL fold metallo-hydrolase [Aquisalimonas lutea]MDN3517843.1 MBL fold metallo-hydrolase [Aquisalimonas lutea]
MTTGTPGPRREPPVESVLHPEVGEPVEVAEGIVLLRLPLPFALDHVNVYLLDEGDGWAILDTGLDTPECRSIWEAALRSPLLRGRPVRRLLVSHHHPDHVGLAGWLARWWDVPMEMTEPEYRVSARYKDDPAERQRKRVRFWAENGLSGPRAQELVHSMPDYQRIVHELPDEVAFIEPEYPLEAGGRTWQVLIGKGHSPYQVSLFHEGDDLLLSADQVLPGISPNIGVWPDGAQNPLEDYLHTIAPFAELGRNPLVLPGHRAPFRGLARRVRELTDHHDQRLRRLHTHCSAPTTCYEALPAIFDRELAREQIGFAMGEGLAHLHYLHDQGCLELRTDDGTRRFHQASACT